MNLQVCLLILSFVNVWMTVFTRGLPQGYVVTDTRQIPNLNANERATLGQLISSLGEKNVEITIIEDKPQPATTIYQQQPYGKPNQNQYVNTNPQIDIIEVYTTDLPIAKPETPHRGPPPPRPPPPERYPPPYPGRDRHRRPPPPGRRRPPPPPYYDEDDRYPPPPPRGHGRYPPPPPPGRERYPPPPPPEYEFDNDHPHHPHRKHHKHRNRGPPPPPVFDHDDPRKEGEGPYVFGGTTENSEDIIYPGATASNSGQHNINLSDSTKSPFGKPPGSGKVDHDYDSDEEDDENIAGYINDFPVVLLTKNEIRK